MSRGFHATVYALLIVFSVAMYALHRADIALVDRLLLECDAPTKGLRQ